MKLNSFLLLACSFLLFACDDTLSEIGSSTMPDNENLSVKSAAFEIPSSTFVADSIYVKTSNPLLGIINDQLFGTIESDYAAQFYVDPNFTFNVTEDDSVVYDMKNPLDSMINNRLDSAILSISYESFIGDSLAPMGVTAYEIQKTLPKDFYSNVDFQPYVTPLKKLGSAAYTGKDMSISDSLRATSSYVPYVDIRLNQEICQRFLNAVKNTPEVFKNEEAFQKLFKGVYLKTTLGNGTMLKVSATSIYFFYRTYHNRKANGEPLIGSDGKDSSYVVSRMKYIAVTQDVLQLNHVSNPVGGGNAALLHNDSSTYITSPGGYLTQIKLPIGSIMKSLETTQNISANYLNCASLNIEAYAPTSAYGTTPPPYLLMVEKSKMNEFFEKNKLPDSKSSYMAAYSSDSTNTPYSYGYKFANINQLILYYADQIKANNGSINETDTITMALVPINATYSSSTYVSAISRVSNYFSPGGVALKSGKNTQKSIITYTQKSTIK